MTAVAAPADRRFHRAHIKPARRRSWRALVRTSVTYALLTVALAYAAYRSGVTIARGRLLQIDRVVVRGNSRLSAGEVMSLVDGLQGENILWANLDSWRTRVMASPWVRDASLHRSLPSTIEIAVSEREPVAIGRTAGSLYLVDDHGLVVDDYGPQYADLDLPIVDGLAAPSDGSGAEDGGPRAALMARVLQSLGAKPEVFRRVSQINVNDEHNAAVVLNGDPTVLRIGEDDFLNRIESYIELSGALHERVPQADYVDLRFDNRVYVRPVGGARSSVGKTRGPR